MMIQIGPEQLKQLLDFPSLIEALKKAFCADWIIPQRHHHDFANPKANRESTLLLMPAWAAGDYLGVKTVIVAPNNHRYQLPSIQGIYTLFDADKGLPLAQMDAPVLTAQRTAAASALASSFLSRTDSNQLLLIGTGALAIPLIQAHASVRPLEKVYVWGRNFTKAQQIADQFQDAPFTVNPIKQIVEVISEVDIISCATLSPEPLVFGKYLRSGQHVDLIGAYRPDMREADDEVIRRSHIFVDSKATAPKETGDLAIPLSTGVLHQEDIKADLFELCKRQHSGRNTPQQITLFKSVGHALEDLAAARLAYEQLNA